MIYRITVDRNGWNFLNRYMLEEKNHQESSFKNISGCLHLTKYFDMAKPYLEKGELQIKEDEKLIKVIMEFKD